MNPGMCLHILENGSDTDSEKVVPQVLKLQASDWLQARKLILCSVMFGYGLPILHPIANFMACASHLID